MANAKRHKKTASPSARGRCCMLWLVEPRHGAERNRYAVPQADHAGGERQISNLFFRVLRACKSFAYSIRALNSSDIAVPYSISLVTGKSAEGRTILGRASAG